MARKCVPVAQLDRASASGVEGLAFESRRAYHFFVQIPETTDRNSFIRNSVKILFGQIFLKKTIL